MQEHVHQRELRPTKATSATTTTATTATTATSATTTTATTATTATLATKTTPATSATKKRKERGWEILNPHGAGFEGCLSATDIDAVVAPFLPAERRLAADILFRVRTERIAASSVEEDVKKRLKRVKEVCAPLHVRYHWALAVFSKRGEGIHVQVLDSAPSMATRDDIRRVLGRLHVTTVEFVPCARQPRGSEECGIHVIINTWRSYLGLPPTESQQMDFNHLRGPIGKLAKTCVAEDAWYLAKHLKEGGPGASGTPPREKESAQHHQYRKQTYTNDPYASCRASIGLAGGGGDDAEIITEYGVNRRNYCYIHAATQMVNALDPRYKLPRTIGELRAVRDRVNDFIDATFPGRERFAEGKPFCAGDLAVYLADSRFQFMSASEGAGRVGTGPTLVSGGVRALFEVPRTHYVVGMMVFRGATTDGYAYDGHNVFLRGVPVRASDVVVAWGLLPFTTASSPIAVSAQPVERARHVLMLKRVPVAPEQVASPMKTPLPIVTLKRPSIAVAPATTPLLELAALSAPGGARVKVRLRRASDGPEVEATGVLRHGLRNVRHQTVGFDVPLGAEKCIIRFGPPTPGEPVLIAAEQIERSHPVIPLVWNEVPPRAKKPTTAQPLDQRPAMVKRTVLVQLLRGMRIGDTVLVHWTRRGVAGKWLGRITELGARTTVTFEAQRCPECQEWRRMEATEVDLPAPKTTIFSFEGCAYPTAFNCGCSAIDLSREDEEDDGEERIPVMDPDRATMRNIAHSDVTTVRGDVGRCWAIATGKPGHVHALVWRQLSAGTRKQHTNWLGMIKMMPHDLAKAPLGSAVVEVVLRMANQRGWKWSTVASALSAAASALAGLPIYTMEVAGIDLKKCPQFAAAMRRAQHLARVDTAVGDISTPMELATFDLLTGRTRSDQGIRVPNVRLLLQMCWHFAARVGDMRQVCPADIAFKENRGELVNTSVTFRFGKGAAWWGPYTIHARLPAEVAKNLRATIGEAGRIGDEPLFRLSDQASLSTTVGRLALNLRSIRRGAIMHAASCGVSDEDLQQLSGHKRRDTLMRYLGWGRSSASAQQAATNRAEKQQQMAPRGAGVVEVVQPPKMGLYSGRVGKQGRRVAAAPNFFPKTAPTRASLGLPSDVDTSAWPLHIKSVGSVNWKAIQNMAAGTVLQDEVQKAGEWCNGTTGYGPSFPVVTERIALARFTEDQVRELLTAGKITPYCGPILGAVNAFLVPEPSKKRLRPIFEPWMNRTLDRVKLCDLQYPSRYERRAKARGARYIADFDFAAYFDQFKLAEESRPWFVLRSPVPVNGHRLFALTRMPMGACFAPGVAQVVTWLLVHPIITGKLRVNVDTMIDNVRICSDSPGDFIRAIRMFLERVKMAGITLNNASEWDTTDETILRNCSVTEATTSRLFLGEKYEGGKISNSDGNVEKLQQAMKRYDEVTAGEGTKYTIRHFASLIGLMLFMAHTLDVALAGLFPLLRAYGYIVGHTTGWDAPFTTLSRTIDMQVRSFAQTLLHNEALPLPVVDPPSCRNDDYDAIVIVDASASGWGAYVTFPATGTTWVLRQRWTTTMTRSAHAEPKAALRALFWARQQHPGANVALVTDHIAIATGQRRWSSRYGGFSTSYHLNELYKELYARGTSQVFFVQGENNMADGPSRDPSAQLSLTATRVAVTIPSLTVFAHPYAKQTRPWYCM